MAVNDVYQVTMRGSLHGQLILNTFHYRVTAVGAGDATTALLTAFKAGPWTQIKAALADEFSFDGNMAQRIRPLPPLVGVDDFTAVGAGNVPGGSLPTSMAVVISKKTALAGRKYRGRVYLAGVSTAHESDSTLNVGGVGLFLNVANAMDNSLVEGTHAFTPVVYHRGDGTTTDVTQCLVREILRNQRRRQVAKGV